MPLSDGPLGTVRCCPSDALVKEGSGPSMTSLYLPHLHPA